MKRTVSLKAGVILAVFGVLISCTSFPAPKSDDDTVLIIPKSTIREASEQFFGNCQIRIIRIEDSHETLYQIDPNSHYGIIAGLPPGHYVILETAAKYKEGGTAWAQKTDIKFSLVPNCITILPQEFVFKIEKVGKENQYQMWLSWGALTQSTAKKLLLRLSEEENFQSWELSESTKENQAISQVLSEL